MRLRISIRGRVRPSVGPSVRPSRVIFEGKKSSNNIIDSDTLSDDEVVASYVPSRYLFLHIIIISIIITFFFQTSFPHESSFPPLLPTADGYLYLHPQTENWVRLSLNEAPRSPENLRPETETEPLPPTPVFPPHLQLHPLFLSLPFPLRWSCLYKAWGF